MVRVQHIYNYARSVGCNSHTVDSVPNDIIEDFANINRSAKKDAQSKITEINKAVKSKKILLETIEALDNEYNSVKSRHEIIKKLSTKKAQKELLKHGIDNTYTDEQKVAFLILIRKKEVADDKAIRSKWTQESVREEMAFFIEKRGRHDIL